MALKDLNDDEIKALVQNSEGFLNQQKNMEKLLGVDSTTKRRFADIMKYDLNMSEAEIKQKLDQVALVKVTKIVVEI
ncbi:hypothetical protein GCM10007160_24190 [Litchfieldella qijiaojingensis]|uniref:Uncharacterized protein n=1 Tax=Litchfieldella qijiaojingensis TaxID=980347 RepID=A0ABQ2YV91_9GAMM|nr:hypothetical protein [Halomonas qijiaojingensis]GGX95729.1 hypothetical protein GCM10007160_24190 [Halomonas qijiaojingensis]